MGWSKVRKPLKKPVGWWYHKLLCEAGYFFGSTKGYYRHLNALCKFGFNLYGEAIKQPTSAAD